jgi:hypothetical protein
MHIFILFRDNQRQMYGNVLINNSSVIPNEPSGRRGETPLKLECAADEQRGFRQPRCDRGRLRIASHLRAGASSPLICWCAAGAAVCCTCSAGMALGAALASLQGLGTALLLACKLIRRSARQ